MRNENCVDIASVNYIRRVSQSKVIEEISSNYFSSDIELFIYYA